MRQERLRRELASKSRRKMVRVNRPANSKPWLLAFTMGVLASLVGIAYFVRTRPPTQAQRALSHESTLQDMVEGYNETYRRELPESLAVADPRRVINELDGNRQALLAHYEEYFRYPHNSRPLNDDMLSLLDPLKAQTLPSPVYKTSAQTPTEKPAYYVQFFAPRQAVAGDEVFTATLRVTDATTGRVVMPSIEKAVIRSDLKTGRVELGVPEYGRSPEDGSYAFSWKAPAKTRLYWGELELSVDARVDDVAVSQDLSFSSTPAEPAKFTGTFNEKIVDGSLVVSAQVIATDPGSYVFEGNLYHQKTNAPVSWSRNLVTLIEGTQDVKFLFFGKIFHDKKLEGTFVLRQLRGYRLNRPYDPATMLDRESFIAQRRAMSTAEQARSLEIADEPLHAFVAVWPRDFVTASYALQSFSGGEYNGEDKQRTLEGIQAYNDTGPNP